MPSRMIIAFLGFGLCALLAAPLAGQQPFRFGPPSAGGGPPSFFGGGMKDPNQVFEFLARGRGYFLISDTRMFREPLTQWAKEKGLTTDQITREQFQTFFTAFNERMKTNPPGGPFGMKPPFPAPGGPPGTSPGSPPGPGAAPPGSDDAKERMNQWVEMRFKERDRNGDGNLNADEMNDSLRADLARWDINKDGLMDLNEYKAYAANRYQGGWQGNSQPANPVVSMIIEEELDRRPVIFRAGKLPKELPSWFEQLDTDKDGQVALYEWRQAKRAFDEFKTLDRNDDGYLTAEEMLRNQTQTRTAANQPNSAGPAISGFSPGGSFNSGNGNGPGRGFGSMFGRKKGPRE